MLTKTMGEFLKAIKEKESDDETILGDKVYDLTADEKAEFTRIISLAEEIYNKDKENELVLKQNHVDRDKWWNQIMLKTGGQKLYGLGLRDGAIYELKKKES